MESFQSLLHMGGYGGYVWPAYGLGAVLLVLVLALSLASARRNEAELEALQAMRRANRGQNGRGKVSESEE
jgi:heme exporter protein D